MKSLAFDQAVSFYDKTRVEPGWVMDAVADSFIRETRATPAAKILEIGVGTGRIALPLLQRGLSLCGVDLSYAMMVELQKKIERRNFRVALAQADAVALPFPSATFDSAYAVHVFHLVAGWQNALAEVHRVLKTDGYLLLSFHHRAPDSPNVKLRKKLGALALERGVDARRPGVPSADAQNAELEKWDGGLKRVEAARWVSSATPAQVIDQIAARIYADTWLIPPDLLSELIPQLGEWARAEFGDLTRAVQEESRFNWSIVRKS